MTTMTQSPSMTAPLAGGTLELEAPTKAPAKRVRRAPFVALFLAVAAAGGMFAYRAATHGRESTDDAQIEGHVLNVSARVAGQVQRVLVTDNQLVHAGDVLVELDRSDLEARAAVAAADVNAARATVQNAEAAVALAERSVEANLTQARGGLRQSQSSLRTTQAGIAQSRADVRAAESRLTLARTEFERTRSLFAQGAVARSALDAGQAQLDQAQAQTELARARLEASQTGVANSQGAIETARGRVAVAETGPQQVEQARAALSLAQARLAQAQASERLAQLNLSFTTVRATGDGLVSRRTVEPGQMVDPSRPLLAIVSMRDLWVVANFKEDQVGAMHHGQRVEFTVDTFPGRHFTGTVDSVAAATGARFSLLPPDNASGNFVKVTQRIPVLLHIDPTSDVQLRAGMSAEVTVRTESH